MYALKQPSLILLNQEETLIEINDISLEGPEIAPLVPIITKSDNQFKRLCNKIFRRRHKKNKSEELVNLLESDEPSKRITTLYKTYFSRGSFKSKEKPSTSMSLKPESSNSWDQHTHDAYTSPIFTGITPNNDRNIVIRPDTVNEIVATRMSSWRVHASKSRKSATIPNSPPLPRAFSGSLARSFSSFASLVRLWPVTYLLSDYFKSSDTETR